MKEHTVSGPSQGSQSTEQSVAVGLLCSRGHSKDSLDLENLCCCSVAQLCSTPWDHMNCSMPGFPVLHYLPEFVQTHFHWVSDAIQPSHPLLPPSSLVFNLSHHQGLFQTLGFPPNIRLFTSDGQNIGASASASVLPKKVIKNSKIRHGHIDWRRIPCLDRQCSMFS